MRGQCAHARTPLASAPARSSSAPRHVIRTAERPRTVVTLHRCDRRTTTEPLLMRGRQGRRHLMSDTRAILSYPATRCCRHRRSSPTSTTTSPATISGPSGSRTTSRTGRHPNDRQPGCGSRIPDSTSRPKRIDPTGVPRTHRSERPICRRPRTRVRSGPIAERIATVRTTSPSARVSPPVSASRHARAVSK